MCIEGEKDNFKSREVNCLKECALALIPVNRLVSNPICISDNIMIPKLY